MDKKNSKEEEGELINFKEIADIWSKAINTIISQQSNNYSNTAQFQPSSSSSSIGQLNLPPPPPPSLVSDNTTHFFRIFARIGNNTYDVDIKDGKDSDIVKILLDTYYRKYFSNPQ